jgi:hypothetical protein
MATKGMNDFYLEGVEYEDVSLNGPLFQQVKKHTEELDKTCSRRPELYGLLVTIIFKKLPSARCLDLLSLNQFEVTVLEKNPYIKS